MIWHGSAQAAQKFYIKESVVSFPVTQDRFWNYKNEQSNKSPSICKNYLPGISFVISLVSRSDIGTFRFTWTVWGSAAKGYIILEIKEESEKE